MKRLVLAVLTSLTLTSLTLTAQETGVTEKDGPGRRVQADEIDKYLKDKNVFFLDVREPKELEELGTIEGYYHIPLGDLEKRLGELPKDRLILTA